MSCSFASTGKPNYNSYFQKLTPLETEQSAPVVEQAGDSASYKTDLDRNVCVVRSPTFCYSPVKFYVWSIWKDAFAYWWLKQGQGQPGETPPVPQAPVPLWDDRRENLAGARIGIFLTIVLRLALATALNNYLTYHLWHKC